MTTCPTAHLSVEAAVGRRRRPQALGAGLVQFHQTLHLPVGRALPSAISRRWTPQTCLCHGQHGQRLTRHLRKERRDIRKFPKHEPRPAAHAGNELHAVQATCAFLPLAAVRTLPRRRGIRDTHRSLDLVARVAERQRHVGGVHVREHAPKERQLPWQMETIWFVPWVSFIWTQPIPALAVSLQEG